MEGGMGSSAGKHAREASLEMKGEETASHGVTPTMSPENTAKWKGKVLNNV